MTTSVQDATPLVDALYVDAQLLFQQVYLLVKGKRRSTEEPGTAEGSSSYHHCIDTIVVESRVSLLQRLDVSVTDDGDVDAWIAFHLTYQRPVRLTGIHL